MSTGKEESGFVSRITSTITNKPLKKIYRIILFGLIIYISSNSSSNLTITDTIMNSLKETMCVDSTINNTTRLI